MSVSASSPSRRHFIGSPAALGSTAAWSAWSREASASHFSRLLPGLPQFAEAIRNADLAPLDLTELPGSGLGLERSTPLWYYLLREAELMNGGQTLGAVGGRIVGEVILGLLQADRDAYLAAAPHWTPTLPSSAGIGQFRMVDSLSLAGADPASRAQSWFTAPAARRPIEMRRAPRDR